jgi:hypothetical protein
VIPRSGLKLKSWTVECAVAQGDYVVIDLKKKKNRIIFYFHESYLSFNKNECKNGSSDASCFNLHTEFQDYACNVPWTGKRLGCLLNNVTRINGALLEAKKRKKKSFPNDLSVFLNPCKKPEDPHKVVHQEEQTC